MTSTAVTVLEPSGVLDGNSANDLCNEIVSHIQQGSTMILLNFQNIDFMNSSGIGALVAMLKVARKQKCQIFVCELSSQVKAIFKITKLDKLFNIFETEEDFNQSLNQPAP